MMKRLGCFDRGCECLSRVDKGRVAISGLLIAQLEGREAGSVEADLARERVFLAVLALPRLMDVGR